MKSMMQILVGLVLVVSLNAQAQLPEFTELVDDVSPSVVNISTRSSQPTSRPQQMPDLQNLPPFFREEDDFHTIKCRRRAIGPRALLS